MALFNNWSCSGEPPPLPPPSTAAEAAADEAEDDVVSTAVCWAARAEVVEVLGGMVGTRWLELEAAVVVEEKNERCAKEAHSSRAPKHSVVAAIVRFNKWRAEAIITMVTG